MDFANLIINALECLGVIGGVIFAMYQWLQHKKIHNAKMLMEFSKTFESNPAISEFIRKIDYNEKWYNSEFHGSPFEKVTDCALSNLSHFVKMTEDNIIKESDFYALSYIIRRTLENEYTQKYFKFLSHRN